MPTYRQLPAEWAPQAAVLLTWPHDRGDWGTNLPAVENNFVELARAISRFEPLLISCRDDPLREMVRRRLLEAGVPAKRFQIAVCPSNDVWARDHGPITVLEDGRPVLLNFRFNGWGGKFDAGLDDWLSRGLHEQGLFGNTALEDVDCVLEGGAIDTDGQGVMLTTTNCLPLPSRNPGMSRDDFEQLFREHFGIHTTHWLDHGHLAGDDTDGHIDTLARFVDPQTIVYQGCDDPQDEQYAELQAMGRELKALRRPDGRPYRLVALPLPAPILDEEGRRLPAGYANFLIINGAVLMPVYGDPADRQAAELLAPCFAGRELVTVDCRALIHQYGSLHCVTMQIPEAVCLPALQEPTQA